MKNKRKEINRLVLSLRWLFGIQNYDFSFSFPDKEEDFEADIEIKEDYQCIHMRVFPKFWRNSLEDQRKCIVHELSHFLCNPLSNIVDRMSEGELQTEEHIRVATEKTTSQIENVIDHLLKDIDWGAKLAYKKYAAQKHTKVAHKKKKVSQKITKK